MTVQPGEDASAVTCTNPAGVALPGFAVGMEVKLGCKLAKTASSSCYQALVRERRRRRCSAKIKYGRALYEYDEAWPPGEKHLFVAYKARGILESLEPPTISLGEGFAPFSCTEHEDRALGALTYGDEHEFAHEAEVGDKAAMACVPDGDALVLVELGGLAKLDNPFIHAALRTLLPVVYRANFSHFLPNRTFCAGFLGVDGESTRPFLDFLDVRQGSSRRAKSAPLTLTEGDMQTELTQRTLRSAGLSQGLACDLCNFCW